MVDLLDCEERYAKIRHELLPYFSMRMMPATATPNRLVLPLAALGTATAAVLLKARFGRALRRIINTVDSIQPTEEEVASHQHQTPSLLPSEVEECIRESDERPVVAGAERKIRWAKNNSRHQKTEYAVVFLHGWGACRQECRPVPERLAEAIGANLYCNRLPGHGRRHKRGRLGGGGPDGDTLVDEAHPRALMESAVEALRIGLAIGEKVILLGMSTGGVLATWLATLPSICGLDAKVGNVIVGIPKHNGWHSNASKVNTFQGPQDI